MWLNLQNSIFYINISEGAQILLDGEQSHINHRHDYSLQHYSQMEVEFVAISNT